MKYFMAIFATIALCFGFVACGDEKEDTATAEDTAGDAGAGSDASDGGAEGEGEGEEASPDAGGEE